MLIFLAMKENSILHDGPGFSKFRSGVGYGSSHRAIEPQSHRDKKIRGDKEKGGQGDKMFFYLSPCPTFPGSVAAVAAAAAATTCETRDVLLVFVG